MMGQRRAKKEACRVVALLIDSYLGVGQPANDCEERVKGWTPEDEQPLTRAFEALQLELERRGAERA